LFRHGSDIDHLLFFSKVLFASLKEEFRREGKKEELYRNISKTYKQNKLGVVELERTKYF
jgi:hypothetical protein